MTSREIRKEFIEFFTRQNGHTFVPSSSVVPHDDPTLLFANAGMNQFKPYFLGTATAPWKRVANTQKCIRAGGKHNDLDDVGRSRRHHTFFEMLGNWSFGDYFKTEAIEMAWKLLTEVWEINPLRLHVTIYAGNPSDNVPADEEAARLWKQIAGLPDHHIHRFVDENFWEMGETGPCGPCTEIFIDRTPDMTGGPLVNSTDPRVMEIWNLVFIQYNRGADRKLTPLPAQHVDTGMGLERICQVLQDKNDNYATDLFTPLFSAIGDLCGKRYTGVFPAQDQGFGEDSRNPVLACDIAFRVIADHIRCLTFALTDSAIPGNEGRGYVLRRILRRAVRFGRQNLELQQPFLHQLVPVIVSTMGEAFPELTQSPQRVAALIEEEERSFSRTLDRGLELFQLAANAASTASHGHPVISARDAFKLHDTFGFPIDLTQIMAREQNLDVDIHGYEQLMRQAREKARTGGKVASGGLADMSPNVLVELAKLHIQPTDDHNKYDPRPLRTHITAIWDGHRLHESITANEGGTVALLLEKTNFYAEMGGQVGDQGEIKTDAGAVFIVESVRQIGGYVLHVGHVKSGKIQCGDSANASVFSARKRIEKNHTATHLANWALRETLGDHVEQKGSLVDGDKLRFDFVQPRALDDHELEKVETLVREAIAKRMTVYTQVAPLEDAKTIRSLRAVFGEKYPPMVRVVSIGVPVSELLARPDDSAWRQYSIEFCSGTHLATTADAEDFAIVSEESVSKGIRRLVAVTGPVAQAARRRAQTVEGLIASFVGTRGDDLETLAGSLQQASRDTALPLLTRRRAMYTAAQIQELLKKQQKQRTVTQNGPDLNAAIAMLVDQAQALGDMQLIVGQLPDADVPALRAAMDALKKTLNPVPVAVLLASTIVETDKKGNLLPPKVNIVAAVSDSLISRISAGDWVKTVAPIVGGTGGGRPQMAMGGGKDVHELAKAMEAARSFALARLPH
ncbi:MAG: alanine--tRNA ligase [Phycisphaerae bacterium]